MKRDTINIKEGVKLQNDNVYVTSAIKTVKELTGLDSRKGLECMVISEGTIVNAVSDGYGHLPNERFYYEVEHKLIDADINYVTRSINRENRSFVVDYILSDERYHINVKNGTDKIRPMLRFTNSYDGSCKTSGHFGFFREVCSNGLHVAQTNIGFSVKHRGNIIEIVLPEIGSLVNKFIDNEFYSLQRKFEVLAETPITDMREFVQYVCGKTGLFQYEKSEKNPDPSLNAQMVIDIMSVEGRTLNTRPNLWLGYNAFNEVLHGKLKQTFEKQKKSDAELFETVLSLS